MTEKTSEKQEEQRWVSETTEYLSSGNSTHFPLTRAVRFLSPLSGSAPLDSRIPCSASSWTVVKAQAPWSSVLPSWGPWCSPHDPQLLCGFGSWCQPLHWQITQVCLTSGNTHVFPGSTWLFITITYQAWATQTPKWALKAGSSPSVQDVIQFSLDGVQKKTIKQNMYWYIVFFSLRL